MLSQFRSFSPFEPLDVGFDLLGHLQQDRRRAAIENGPGEAAALLRAPAHPFDDHAVLIGHTSTIRPSQVRSDNSCRDSGFSCCCGPSATSANRPRSGQAGTARCARGRAHEIVDRTGLLTPLRVVGGWGPRKIP